MKHKTKPLRYFILFFKLCTCLHTGRLDNVRAKNIRDRGISHKKINHYAGRCVTDWFSAFVHSEMDMLSKMRTCLDRITLIESRGYVREQNRLCGSATVQKLFSYFVIFLEVT